MHALVLLMCIIAIYSFIYLQEAALIELKLGGDPYEQLRPGEKSRPVPNLTDTSYSHIPKRKSKQILTAPDVVFRSRSEVNS